ncbi:MAG: uracil-DNA glycosylase [Bacillaceae bacterium]
MIEINNNWKKIIEQEQDKPYFKRLMDFLETEYAQNVIYPKKEDIFKALELTDYEDVKVVILGQDPYHGEGQAQGLSFSVAEGIKLPPSLLNIFKERKADIGVDLSSSGSLIHWAQQGILLLNTVLTVQAGKAHSHKGKGWEQFTDAIIKALNEREKPIIFVLWGRPAQAKKALITNPNHVILESVHPSPLSASKGFFGSKPFSKINAQLREWGEKEIQF